MATHFTQFTTIQLYCTPLVNISFLFLQIMTFGFAFLCLVESFVQPKTSQNVYFTCMRVKKFYCSIHHINRQKQLFPLFFSKYLSLLFPTVRQT